MGRIVRRWTEEELMILKARYPMEGSNPLTNVLDRTAIAISKKAIRLKIPYVGGSTLSKTHEQYLKEVSSIQPTLEVLGTYQTALIKIKHRCLICYHTWEATPNNILRKESKCPECYRLRQTYNNYDVDLILEDLELVRLSDYQGSDGKLEVRGACGHTWSTRFRTIQQGSGCPSCNVGFGYWGNKDSITTCVKAYLYILRINLPDNTLIKVGVTSKSVESRVRGILSTLGKDTNSAVSIDILRVFESSGANVLDTERYVLDRFKEYKPVNLDNKFSGYSETFKFNDELVYKIIHSITERLHGYNI